MSLDWNKYPSFKSSEFDHGGPEMHPDFMQKLQLARSVAEQKCKEKDIPITFAYFVITSGSRSESRNRQVGGKPDSTHLYGRACDIKAEYSRSRLIIVESLLLAGFTRLGIGDDFVHVDDGELVTEGGQDHPKDANVIWLY